MSTNASIIEFPTHPAQSCEGKPRRERGRGSVYKSKYRTKDGQLRESRNWSIQYYRYGKAIRENARSDKKTVAEALLRRRLGEIVTGHFIGPKAEKIKYEELVEDLRVEYKNSGNRLDRLETSLARLSKFFAGMRVVEVSSDVVEKYKRLRQLGPDDQGAVSTLSTTAKNATVNRELAALKRMLNLGTEQTPPKVLRVPHIKMFAESQPRQGFFTHPDYIALRQELPDHLRPVVTMAYFTGMRLQEILGLRWEQVDLLNRTIRLSSKDTKNKEPRLVKLGHGELFGTITMQLELRNAKWSGCPWVFFKSGQRIGTFYRAWQSACKRANLSFAQYEESETLPLFHDLRRTAARNMRRAGVPEKVIMQIGGWKTRSVFDRYNIVDEQDIEEAAAKLDKFVAAQNGHSTDKVAPQATFHQEITH